MRLTLTEVSSENIYEAFMGAIWLHQLKEPLHDDESRVFKSKSTSLSTTS